MFTMWKISDCNIYEKANILILTCIVCSLQDSLQNDNVVKAQWFLETCF